MVVRPSGARAVGCVSLFVGHPASSHQVFGARAFVRFGFRVGVVLARGNGKASIWVPPCSKDGVSTGLEWYHTSFVLRKGDGTAAVETRALRLAERG